MSVNEHFDHLFKLLTIGNSGVGKSSILTRYVDKDYKSSFISTIGIDFKIKTVNINDKKIKLQIWDTAGQERFKTITTAYYRGANGIILVYDITNRKSFNDVSEWMNNISKYASPEVKTILVGNKTDLEDKREIKYEEGERMARNYKMQFFEASAKSDINVNSVITAIVTEILKDTANLEDEIDARGVKLNSQGGSSSGGCCKI